MIPGVCIVTKSNEKLTIIIAGLIIGVISTVLVLLGNPKNMGFCIACFIRDTAGALKLHGAKGVMYLRPEIIGIILGSFLLSFGKKEFSPRGGSAAISTRSSAWSVLQPASAAGSFISKEDIR